MTNELSTFTFAPAGTAGPGMELRVIDREGEPWFIAKDVCAALGLAQTHKAMLGLDADEKGHTKVPTPGGEQTLNAVSESGLYALILRSNKPEAKAFRKWVTSVVLPTIRKDGAYIAGSEKVATGEMTPEELMARAVLAAQSTLDRVKADLERSNAKVLTLAAEKAVLEPKAAVVDEVFHSQR